MWFRKDAQVLSYVEGSVGVVVCTGKDREWSPVTPPGRTDYSMKFIMITIVASPSLILSILFMTKDERTFNKFGQFGKFRPKPEFR